MKSDSSFLYLLEPYLMFEVVRWEDLAREYFKVKVEQSDSAKFLQYFFISFACFFLD